MSRKLERAANKTKTWKDKVAKHEGLVRLIQPGGVDVTHQNDLLLLLSIVKQFKF